MLFKGIIGKGAINVILPGLRGIDERAINEGT